jgi:hypothetical protein
MMVLAAQPDGCVPQATNSTAHFLKKIGAVDLAWVAAERGHQAAQILDDPLYLAAADYARAQALIGLGAYDRADAIARNALSMLTPETVASTEVYGMNVLVTAFCSEMAGEDPRGGPARGPGVRRTDRAGERLLAELLPRERQPMATVDRAGGGGPREGSRGRRRGPAIGHPHEDPPYSVFWSTTRAHCTH